MAKSFQVPQGRFSKLAAPVRPLTDQEIETLAGILGDHADRDHLKSWLGEAIHDVVRLSTLPRPRQRRDVLLQLAREGRNWLREINDHSFAQYILQKSHTEKLPELVTLFCDEAEATAEFIGRSIKPGRASTPFLLEVFLDKLIGIAKHAHVVPSIPGRAFRSLDAPRPTPAFFRFVLKALAISKEVIKSSPIPETQKKGALSILRVQSEDALTKILEPRRGKSRNYRKTPDGIVEW